MNRVMGASGAESLNVAASIFMGQTEAPLTIRPYLPRMTQSELMTVMTSGMAHISGGIMAAYIAFGIEAKHLLTAVIMTAPGTLMMAKMFVPETERAGDARHREARDREDRRQRHRRRRPRAPAEGLHLALNVGAMLISFVALIALVNAILGTRRLVHVPVEPADDVRLGVRAGGVEPRRAVAGRRRDRQSARHAHGAERVHRLRAVGRAEGVARSAVVHHRDIRAVRLCELLLDRHSDRRHRRAGAERRHDLARLGLRAMLAGTLANFVTAIIVGFLYPD